MFSIGKHFGSNNKTVASTVDSADAVVRHVLSPAEHILNFKFYLLPAPVSYSKHDRNRLQFRAHK